MNTKPPVNLSVNLFDAFREESRLYPILNREHVLTSYAMNPNTPCPQCGGNDWIKSLLIDCPSLQSVAYQCGICGTNRYVHRYVNPFPVPSIIPGIAPVNTVRDMDAVRLGIAELTNNAKQPRPIRKITASIPVAALMESLKKGVR